MAFTLAGLELQRASIVLPRFGAWVAEAWLVPSASLAVGQRVQLVAGDVQLSGTVRAGGTFAETSSFTIDGGAGGWAKSVVARPYRSDSGILLGDVARDLAAEVGERVQLEPGVERALGYAWARPASLASTALRDLVGPAWWMAADGVTHLGPRPVTTAPSTLRFQVERYSPRLRRAELSSPDDTFAALLPGGSWTANGVPSFTTTWARLAIEAGSVRLEVLG